jgi:hypothetical protein
VSRRTRRARRHLRRGDAHREPLLLVADDRGDLIEWVQLAARISYRYRSELAPVALSSVLMLAAAILHGNHVPAVVGPARHAAGRLWPLLAADRAAAAADRTRLHRSRRRPVRRLVDRSHGLRP